MIRNSSSLHLTPSALLAVLFLPAEHAQKRKTPESFPGTWRPLFEERRHHHNAKKKTGANYRKGELRAFPPFQLGSYSTLHRTGGIPRSLEARPYDQIMPVQMRVRHLDLAARRQQALSLGVPDFVNIDRLMIEAYEAEASSHSGIGNVTMRSAAACDWSPRQRRSIWLGAAYRLAVVALPPLTYVASSLGYELDCVVQELDNQGYQAQESIQPVHRQFTSSRGRRRCRLTGLTPLTYRYYSRSDSIIQTYVRFILTCILFQQHGLVASCDYAPHTKMPRENPRLADALPAGKTVLVIPHPNLDRKAA